MSKLSICHMKGYVHFAYRLKLFVVKPVSDLFESITKKFLKFDFQLKKPPKTVPFHVKGNFFAIVSDFNSCANEFTQVSSFIPPNFRQISKM